MQDAPTSADESGQPHPVALATRNRRRAQAERQAGPASPGDPATQHPTVDQPEPTPRPGGVRQRSTGVTSPLGEWSMTELRHPSESSRFALALLSLAVVTALAVFALISLSAFTTLLRAFLAVVGGLLLLWVTVQLWRVRLVGDAVLVLADTLPEAQQVMDTVKDRLAYRGRVDLFVVDSMSRVLSADRAPVALTTYFGIHVLVVEGHVVGNTP